ncbi:N-acetylmuramoyl-L-alanine amidase [Acetobacterium malicum]|nr:N-acetylmuramoyl-L-alanine amidase [Acetobacterium dehalogenans]
MIQKHELYVPNHVYLSDWPVIANNAGADLFISIHHNG